MPALATMEAFEKLLNESLDSSTPKEGEVVNGSVIAIEAGQAIIDIGYKMEGRVDLREFSVPGQPPEISIGDTVEVYLEKVEGSRGEALLSREKARREEAWDRLEKASGKDEKVDGVIFGRVKGGFTVDLGGAIAFLPGSQVDVRPIRDTNSLMNFSQPFQILKMDRRRGNIVVSRRAILEESRAEQRAELVGNLAEGSIADGVVKNITEYGAFIDLGGVDGLLHVTDMAWRRVNHPSELVNIGDTIKVQVIKINKDTHRISLGMKQLQDDPWSDVEKRYPLGSNHTGRVTNITDYGAFVELESGVEGLVHVSEMSWTKKNVHPGKIVSTSQELEVMVLEIDTEKRRVSLGLKQTKGNPWENFAKSNPVGSNVEGEIKNITEFGLFIGLGEDIDGMVHLTDLDWNKSGEESLEIYKKGDLVKAQVTDIDIEKERISLSKKIHPMLLTRGVPGTHDINMMLDFFKKSKNRKFKKIKLPNFNKATDDRFSKNKWNTINQRPDVIIFEGWCVGAKSENNKTLRKSVNSMEKVKDQKQVWRNYVNQQLKSKYKKLYSQLNCLIFLKAKNFGLLQKWRLKQERKLKFNSSKKSNLKIMNKEDVLNFMQTYQRITQNMFRYMPKYASIIFNLNANHQIKSAVYKRK